MGTGIHEWERGLHCFDNFGARGRHPVEERLPNFLRETYDFMEDNAYWQGCQDIIPQSNSNVQINYGGTVQLDRVIEILSDYYLFFFPTHGGNFGHVILEAFSAGCLVLTSDQTPWRNLVVREIGWDLSLEEPENFYAALSAMVLIDSSSFENRSQLARQYAQSFIENPKLLGINSQVFSDTFSRI